MFIGLQAYLIIKQRLYSGCGASCADEQAHRPVMQAVLLKLGDKSLQRGRLVAKQGDQFFGVFVVALNALAGQPCTLVKSCLTRRQVRLAQQAARP